MTGQAMDKEEPSVVLRVCILVNSPLSCYARLEELDQHNRAMLHGFFLE